MQRYLEKYEKYSSWFFFGLMILCLIPMAALGFFNHPLGDDFYYGYKTTLAWQETGNIFSVLATAFSETAGQYELWQGTYSAMFLMHLPPQMWGDIFYKIYPTILFACFTASTFFLVHTLVCTVLKGSKSSWILISSLLVLTFVEQVPLCGETFYWYNGSMYYTGYLACTFVFFGILIKGLCDSLPKRTWILSLMAIFLAGGNYVSLLPTMILMVLLLFVYAYRVIILKKPEQKTLVALGIILGCMLVGFLISAAAPGNAVRQATALKMSPVKAVLMSIYQNSRYVLYWNGIWSIVFLICVTPVYLGIIEKCTWKFRYPIIVCGLLFGIYCSASCPLFYAQSNGGPARVFCCVYYIMVLTLAMIYFYALGAIYQIIFKKNYTKTLCAVLAGVFVGFVCVTFFQTWNGVFAKPHSVTAAQAILNGDAAYYEQQYQERLSVLEDPSVPDVSFVPYDVPDSLMYFLYLGDIPSDENEDVNQRMAAIYGKSSIKILTSEGK